MRQTTNGRACIDAGVLDPMSATPKICEKRRLAWRACASVRKREQERGRARVRACVRVRVRACVRVCVRALVRACVRACVRARVRAWVGASVRRWVRRVRKPARGCRCA
eukprot:3505489-Pleurochrysis_carterae.AAC.5